MSLINQMLQDLDARRADGAERSTLPRDVRPLPVAHRTPWLRIAVGTIVAGTLTGGAILWFRGHDPQPPASPPAMVAKPIPQAPDTAVAVPSPTAPAHSPAPEAAPAIQSVPAPVADAPAAVPTPEAPGTPIPESKTTPAAPKPGAGKPRTERAETPGLKVATSLSGPGAKAEKPAVAVPARAEEGVPSIDKQARVPSARDRAESEYRKAVGLLNQGRVNEAIAGLHALLREDPGHANARLTLAGVLVEQKNLEEAQTLLQEGLRSDPAQPSLAMRLARIQVERGDPASAAATLQKAAHAASGSAEYRGFHAAVLQRLNRHKDAVEEYQAAVRLVPQAGVWWMGLGISLEADQRAAEAREAYKRAKATGALSPELAGFVEQKLRQLQ